mmetsp:Transcript_4866/g.7408  ORF Transcript_4866/g.7408 Transcript_4866/m.7408 type:complete len:1136 (-) Transcript_4866:239-3646(-)
MSGVPVKSNKKRSKPSDVVWFWANECRYDVILNKIESMGWKAIEDERKESRCNMFWIDSATIHERFRTILPWQVINHFPGMPNIARKNRMGQNLNRMLKMFPREYTYYPRTWVLPAELSDFRAQFDNTGNSLGNKIYIIKPDAGCQGKGIFLVRHFDQVPQQDNVVAQLYIKKPLLIDGYKFDLRIYILITSVKPLRMYMFEDGLVRLCTEEYVKPTKQNLSMMCMHLTNYAVNKKNTNFQQASAQDDDGGSKRSLEWFMNWIREEYGDVKADWLWRRFGTLAVRTVLSILPTLSREYDFHFKSFYNVPVNPPPGSEKYMTKKPSEKQLPKAGTDKKGTAKNGGKGGGAGNRSVRIGEGDDEEAETEGEVCSRATSASSNEDSDGSNSDGEGEEDGGGDKPAEEATSETAGEANNKDDWRGSRCFEILGIDIMVDSHLKPWLIEINHLPSFGTDSPLDRDIKGRLMDEVFNILPVRPDDEQMFTLYHKVEAERRLLAERTTASTGKMREKAVSEKERKEEQERIGRERWSKRRAEMLKEREKEQERAKEAMQAAEIAAANEEAIEAIRETERKKQQDRLEQQQLSDCKPVTPERFQEIKAILSKVYAQYCPSKLGKIDKLLAKYQGREEEFITFVFDKYDVPYELMSSSASQAAAELVVPIPPLAEVTVPLESKPTVSASTESDVAPNPQESSSERLAAQNQAQPPKRLTSNGPKERKPKAAENSRSLSPPHRRSSAAWRGAAEDDEAFRQEVLAQHIPALDDKWIAFESSRLPSFTRIFPPVPKTDDTKVEEEPDDGEAEQDIEDDKRDATGAGVGVSTADASLETPSPRARTADGENSLPAATTVASSTPPLPPEKRSIGKSLEDILFQVFLQDRRQTMRLKCPLGNRSKSYERPSADRGGSDSDRDSQSLPALNEPFRTGKRSSQGSRSLPGWRPPPPREKREPPRASSQAQIDVANKLSKGLSSISQRDEAKGTAARSSNKMIVSARHRIYTNTVTSSGSAAGSIHTHHVQTNHSGDSLELSQFANTPVWNSGYQVQQTMTGIALEGMVDPGGGGWQERGGRDTDSDCGAASSHGTGAPMVQYSNARNGAYSRASPAALRQKTFAFDSNVSPNTLFGESSTTSRGPMRSDF